jgi:hypothetical protein
MTTPPKKPQSDSYKTRRGKDAVYQQERAYKSSQRERLPRLREKREKKDK